MYIGLGMIISSSGNLRPVVTGTVSPNFVIVDAKCRERFESSKLVYISESISANELNQVFSFKRFYYLHENTDIDMHLIELIKSSVEKRKSNVNLDLVGLEISLKNGIWTFDQVHEAQNEFLSFGEMIPIILHSFPKGLEKSSESENCLIWGGEILILSHLDF